jgi:SAM-dependent methyltransferase
MTPFAGTYAKCYDAIYAAKDYAAETQFLVDAMARNGRKVRSVLDLGCGTGGHAIRLAQAGLEVTGVDRSPEMVEQARAKAKEAGVADRVNFEVGDLTTYAGARKYDAVVCLFAVLSYLTANASVLAALRTMKQHLEPDGLLFCDFWYGPSVLRDAPSDRFKIVEHAGARILRLAHPTLLPEENCVSIEYQVFELRGREIASESIEIHKVRYFFAPEIENFLAQAGLTLRALHPSFRPDDPITAQEWTVMLTAS